ncbi:ABC transporter permease [Derxia lacustris]|uniref:ABC transporter permease n=1 Tax=Derxia lacustris TaxID=764842 RepID=UPI001F36206B|nr:ABC transporter permease [Derxia lacustris]
MAALTRFARRWRTAAIGLLLPVGFLVAVEIAVRAGLIEARFLPAPSELLQTLAELAGGGELARHIGASVVRVLAGFAIGSALALALGALVGLNRRAEALLDPTLQGLRAIPSLAWVPLLLLWLGIDELPKITLIAIGAFFPVYLGVTSGIRDVDRKLVEVGAMAGLGRLAQVRRIFLPASLPAVMTGLRGGLGLAWMFLVAAELIASTRGLGYLLSDGRETSRVDVVLAAIVLLALLGKLGDSVLQAIEHRALAWRDTHDRRAD